MDEKRYKNECIGQYARENHRVQDNRNRQKAIILPHKIYGMREKQLRERIEAQKQYRWAKRCFIAAYQSHEKIGVLLQEAKAMGDIAKIEHLSHLYMESISDLMHHINSMDQAKKPIK